MLTLSDFVGRFRLQFHGLVKFAFGSQRVKSTTKLNINKQDKSRLDTVNVFTSPCRHVDKNKLMEFQKILRVCLFVCLCVCFKNWARKSEVFNLKSPSSYQREAGQVSILCVCSFYDKLQQIYLFCSVLQVNKFSQRRTYSLFSKKAVSKEQEADQVSPWSRYCFSFSWGS